MSQYKTEQEAFWAGDFGNDYIDRNQGTEIVAANLAFFAKVLARTRNINDLLEFGSNRGLNLLALRQLLPFAGLSAVEINQKAVAELEKLGYLEKIYHTSILDFTPDYQRDLVFIKGVMIHLNPEVLPQVYDLLYQSSKRYILVMEYYNSTPAELTYRGHSGKLFKRDFAGEILDRFPDLQLIDYGFCYERDYMFPNGDCTWFLMEKR
jgi:spore coat polysaccharide biosynthesis protein SpsF